MVRVNPYRELGCSCDTRTSLMAALEGKPVPLCEVHDAEAIEARQVAERRQAELEQAERVRQAVAEVDAAAAQAEEAAGYYPAASLKDVIGRELRKGVEPSSSMPLNAPTAEFAARMGIAMPKGEQP